MTDAVHLEHLFGDDRPAEDGGDAEGDDGDNRDQGIAQDMYQHHRALGQSLGPGGAHIVLAEIVQHRGPHESAELRCDLQGKHHDGEDHLFQLDQEAVPVVHDMGGVVDRGKPAELDRKDHDGKHPGEERRNREPDHRDEGPGLVKDRILAIGRIDADRQGDQHCHHVGHANHPECLRDALYHDVHDR